MMSSTGIFIFNLFIRVWSTCLFMTCHVELSGKFLPTEGTSELFNILHMYTLNVFIQVVNSSKLWATNIANNIFTFVMNRFFVPLQILPECKCLITRFAFENLYISMICFYMCIKVPLDFKRFVAIIALELTFIICITFNV